MGSAADIRVKIGADMTRFRKKMSAMQKTLKKNIASLERSGRKMSTALTLPIIAGAGAAIKSAADIDKLKKGLEGLMQDSKGASKEFGLLVRLAKNPGLDLQSAVKGSIKLQAIGFSADKSRFALTQLANAVALVGGSGDDLNGVTTAIQQIISKGKVHAEEINQMAERYRYEALSSFQQTYGCGFKSG